MDKVYNKDSANKEEQIDENMGLSDIIDILNTLDYNSPGSNETVPTCPTNKTNASCTISMSSSSGSSSPLMPISKQNQNPGIESKLPEKSEKPEKPYIKIVEQPANKALRFRYECEGRSAGSIPGANSTSEIKTFPVIEIANYKGEVTLVVSCVTKDPPYRPHPHNLVGKEGCVHGVYTVRIKGDPPRAVLNNLGVQCVRRKDIKAALELRESKNIDPFKNQPSSIDLNVVRLCFQAFIQTGPRQFKKLQPVVSEPVYDRKAVSNLAINRLCSCSAKVSGGDEIIMLCEKVTKEIKIKFYELNNEGYEIWHDYAEFHHSDIHKNTAIAFKTPRYPNATNITQRIQVYIQLERPSDGATSEPLPFEYYPDQDQIKRKRLKSGINAMNILRRELQKHEQTQNINGGSTPKTNMWNVTTATTPSHLTNVQTVINANLPDIKPEGYGIPMYQNFDSHRNSYVEMSSPSPQPLSPMNGNIGTPSPSNLIMKTSSGSSQTQMMNSFNQVTIQSLDGMKNNANSPSHNNNLNNMNLLYGDHNFLTVPTTNYTMNNNSNSNINNNNSTSHNNFGSASSAFVNGSSGGTFTPLWAVNDNNSSPQGSNNKCSSNNISNGNNNNNTLPDISYFSNFQHNANFQQNPMFVNDSLNPTMPNIFQHQPQQQQQQEQQDYLQQHEKQHQQQQQHNSINAGNVQCDTFSSLLQIESDQFLHLNSDDLKLSNLSISTCQSKKKMNVEHIQEGLDCLLHCGQKLTPEQKILIENSLIVLQNENHFAGIYFWGRINGIKNDYYIAFGYLMDCLKDRKYFYSTDCYQWLMLPFVSSPKIFQAAILCRELFNGDPSKIITVKLDPTFEVDANQVISATLPEEVSLKEEDRLAAIVFIITEECAICPRGALYKLTDGRIIPNPMFRGLNDLQCEDLSYYQIFRLPRNDLKMNLAKRSDYNYPIDFLDSIECVIPSGQAFALNLQHYERLVIIKSCVWLGMTFFHKLNSRKHGFLYMGDGKKNCDLLFML